MIFLFLLPKPWNSFPIAINLLFCSGIPPHIWIRHVMFPAVSARAMSPCKGVIEICTERDSAPADTANCSQLRWAVVCRYVWVNLDGLGATQLSSHESCCNELPKVIACIEELAKRQCICKWAASRRETNATSGTHRWRLGTAAGQVTGPGPVT